MASRVVFSALLNWSARKSQGKGKIGEGILFKISVNLAVTSTVGYCFLTVCSDRGVE